MNNPRPLLGVLLFAALGFAARASDGPEEVALTSFPDRVRIEVGGKLFTEYIFSGARRPYFYPVLAADGTRLNRDYPMRNTPGEDQDHIHHRSLWFAHSAVGGFDFWNETAAGLIPKGRIAHDALLETTSGPIGVLRASNRWLSPAGTLVCTDVTTVRFQGGADSRILDYEVTIHALPGASLRFGDNKDGAMAIRVAQWMTLPHKYGNRDLPGAGRYLTSAGARDAAAWGTHADWCDLFAPHNGKVYGIALFDDPRNLHHPGWWMSRDYGLLAENPFGLQNYDRVLEKPTAGDTVLPAGGSLTLRYRFYFHEGDPATAKVGEHYEEFLKGND